MQQYDRIVRSGKVSASCRSLVVVRSLSLWLRLTQAAKALGVRGLREAFLSSQGGTQVREDALLFVAVVAGGRNSAHRVTLGLAVGLLQRYVATEGTKPVALSSRA